MALYYVELKSWCYGVAVGAAVVGVAVAFGSGVAGALPVLVAGCAGVGLMAAVAVAVGPRRVRMGRGVGGVVGKMVPMRVK
ncbi:MAG: hypothetical protein RLY92_1197 [Chloroflexota bacterium]